MLRKLLPVRKIKPPFFRQTSPKSPPPSAPAPPPEPMALKIVHPGGIVEYYFMAVPAHRIMEKYPSFVLARPNVFRRPWDSLIRPEEILTPGEKVYVVPLRTVRKLHRRIRRPIDGDLPVEAPPDRSSNNNLSNDIGKSTPSDHGISAGSVLPRCMDWFSRDDCESESSAVGPPIFKSTPSMIKDLDSIDHRRRWRVRNVVSWSPNLAVVNEV